MTQAGWYPDPAGQPQTYRYWNGSSWSQETTSDPYGPPPRSAVPPPPPPPPPPVPPPPAPGSSHQPQTVLAGGYGQPQPLGGGFPPAPPPSSGRRTGLVIALVVGAVLLLVGLSVAGFVGYRALTDDDSDTGAGGQSSATDSAPTGTTDPTDSTDSTAPTDTTSPSETSTTGGTDPTDQQCGGGVPTPSVEPGPDARKISGGALTIPVPRGYTAETAYSAAFTWADDFTPLQKVIEEGENQGWVSVYGVGGLRKANGFDDPAQAAEVVMTCMSRSTELYSHLTGREDLSSGEITVDGVEAFQITSELRVDDPDLSVEGDVAQVIVVDMGDPEMFGLYLTVVPIGDEELIGQQQAMVDRIMVD